MCRDCRRKAVQDQFRRRVVVGRDVGRALDQHAGRQLDAGRFAQRLGAEPVDIERDGRAVGGVRHECDIAPPRWASVSKPW